MKVNDLTSFNIIFIQELLKNSIFIIETSLNDSFISFSVEEGRAACLFDL